MATIDTTATGAAPGLRLPLDAWADLSDYAPPDGRVLAGVGVAALATDLAVRAGVNVFAGALLVAIVAGGLLGSGRMTNRRSWPVVAAAPAFGLWLALRESPWLIPLDVLGAAGLLLVGSTLSRAGDPTDLTVPGVVGRGLHALAHAVLSPGFLLKAWTARFARGPDARNAGPRWAVVRGALLAAPIVVVIGLLLGSADAVFASFFRMPADVGEIVMHAFLLTVGALGAATLLRVASAAPYASPPTAWRPLGAIEATTVVAALVAVFAVFAAAQAVAVTRGSAYVTRTAGLSYAEYARTGFFQLLAVAAITLTVLLAVRATVDLSAARDTRRFVVLAEVAVALTLVIVGVALRRLHLYEQAYGLTMLRLASTLFAVWIGAVFVIVGLAIAGVGKGRQWVVPAAAAVGLVGMFVTSAINPEALVARRNIERFGMADQFDVAYLADLSDDAVPTIIDGLPQLRADHAAAMRGAL